MELLGIFPLERRKFINEFVSSPNHTADIINQTNLHSGQIRYRNSPLPAKRNNVFYKKEKDFTITIKEKASAESKDLMFRVERSRAALFAATEKRSKFLQPWNVKLQIFYKPLLCSKLLKGLWDFDNWQEVVG